MISLHTPALAYTLAEAEAAVAAIRGLRRFISISIDALVAGGFEVTLRPARDHEDAVATGGSLVAAIENAIDRFDEQVEEAERRASKAAELDRRFEDWRL